MKRKRDGGREKKRRSILAISPSFPLSFSVAAVSLWLSLAAIRNPQSYELSIHCDNRSSDRHGGIDTRVVRLDVALSFARGQTRSGRGQNSRRLRAAADQPPPALRPLGVCADGGGGARLSRLLGVVRVGAARREPGLRGLEAQT